MGFKQWKTTYSSDYFFSLYELAIKKFPKLIRAYDLVDYEDSKLLENYT